MPPIQMRLLTAAMLLSLPVSQAVAQAYDAPNTGLPASVQSHVDAAYRISKGDISKRNLPGTLYLINDKVFEPPVPASRKMANQAPVKMFDQFYYLGVNWVSAWALDTPDGIILFDTLTSPAEGQYLEEGLRKLGLDPAKIKYIVITHGHGDHFGSAKYLQEKYKARVMMSDIDWDIILKPVAAGAPAGPPRPNRDMSISEGQKLTLGGATVTFHLTPGHTPGTISALIPVTDKGRRHTISFIGGTGLNQLTDPSKGGGKILRDSMARFAKASAAARADVLITSHPFLDDSWEKAKVVNDGTAGAISPWVATPDAVQRYYAATTEAVLAIEAYDAVKPAAAPAAH